MLPQRPPGTLDELLQKLLMSNVIRRRFAGEDLEAYLSQLWLMYTTRFKKQGYPRDLENYLRKCITHDLLKLIIKDKKNQLLLFKYANHLLKNPAPPCPSSTLEALIYEEDRERLKRQLDLLNRDDRAILLEVQSNQASMFTTSEKRRLRDRRKKLIGELKRSLQNP